MKINGNPRNKLGLNLFEANLKRHPSVKGLFDEEGNMKAPKESHDEFLLLNVEQKSEGENNEVNNNIEEKNGEKEKEEEIEDMKEISEEEKKQKEKIRTVSVKIHRVEEKNVDNKISYYEELNDEKIKDIIKEKNKNQKLRTKFRKSQPLVYTFEDNQKKFDEVITNAMSKGVEYNEIENKFVNQLKKK